MASYYDRQPLLTQKGRLTDPGWAGEDIYVYNKEYLRPALRRREWEFYQVTNESFAFQVFYGHDPLWGRAGVTLVDFETGERIESGKRRYLPGDSLDLDFSPGEPHTLKYEDKDLFLAIGYDGSERRITVRSDRFDAELSCADGGGAVVTAVPFARKTQFLYQYRKCFPAFGGHIHMHKLDYRLDADTFLHMSGSRGILPYHHSSIWAVGQQAMAGGLLSLNLGEDNGPPDAVTENAIFIDGVMEKLGRVFFKYKAEDCKQPWRITDGQHRLRLEFFPAFDDFRRLNLGAAAEQVHRLYGKLYGRVRRESGEELTVEGMHFFIELSDSRT